MRLTFLTQTGVNLAGKGTTLIRFNFSNFGYINVNTFCGIQQSNSISAIDCITSPNNVNSIDCPLANTDNGTITICCYNININADPINFPVVKFNFQVNPSMPNLSNWMWQTTYHSTSSLTWTTGNSQAIYQTG